MLEILEGWELLTDRSTLQSSALENEHLVAGAIAHVHGACWDPQGDSLLEHMLTV